MSMNYRDKNDQQDIGDMDLEEELYQPLAPGLANKFAVPVFDEHPYPPQVNEQIKKYRDPFFAILFIAHAIVIFCLAIFRGLPAVAGGAIDQINVNSKGNELEAYDKDNPIPIVLSLSVIMVLAAFASLISLKVLISYGESLIRFSFLFAVVCFVIIAGAAASIGQSFLVIVMLLAAACTYCYYYAMDSHIDFAGKNLKVACTAVSSMSGVVNVALGLLAVQACWCMIWSLALIGVATNFSDPIIGLDGTVYDSDVCISYSSNSPNPVFSPKCLSSLDGNMCYKCMCNDVLVYDDRECRTESVNAGIYVAMLLSLLWGCAIISNISHCVTAGAVASWWFNKPNSTLNESSPIKSSLSRACSTSFGTICLASLMVAIARALVVVASSLRRSRRGMGALGTALLECFARAAESVVRIFNRYALCHAAVYGSTLTVAGKEVWTLFKRRGWMAIVNDQLSENVLVLVCAVVGAFCGLFGALAGALLGMSGMVTAVLVSFGVFMGYNLAGVTMNVVSSALATVFVCFAQDQSALLVSNPGLWLEMMQSWHKMHGPTMVNCGYRLP